MIDRPGDTHAPEGDRPALLGQLAHDVSVLLRRDLELAAAEHLPDLRRATFELGMVAAIGIAGLLALGALTWAAVGALSIVLPDWLAALVAAVGWAAVAAALAVALARAALRAEQAKQGQPRLAWLREPTHERIIESHRAARDEAEETMRGTADDVPVAVARETVERVVDSVAAAVQEQPRAAEDAPSLRRELVDAMLAPGRAGIGVLSAVFRGSTAAESSQGPRRPQRRDS